MVESVLGVGSGGEWAVVFPIRFSYPLQLGERQLVGDWNDAVPAWDWGNNINWTANVVEVLNDDDEISFLESVKPYQGHEFRIAKKKIGGKNVRIRLEIKDFVGQSDDIVFPVTSVRKKTENWLMIELE